MQLLAFLIPLIRYFHETVGLQMPNTNITYVLIIQQPRLLDRYGRGDMKMGILPLYTKLKSNVRLVHVQASPSISCS